MSTAPKQTIAMKVVASHTPPPVRGDDDTAALATQLHNGCTAVVGAVAAHVSAPNA